MYGMHVHCMLISLCYGARKFNFVPLPGPIMYAFDKFVVLGIDPDRDRNSLEEVYDQVYANFVEEVDGADNKISSLIGAAKCVHVHVCLCVHVYVCVCVHMCVLVCVFVVSY